LLTAETVSFYAALVASSGHATRWHRLRPGHRYGGITPSGPVPGGRL